MKKFGTVIFMIAFLLPAMALAQEAIDPDFPFELNDAIVTAIMTIGGLGLMSVVNIAKSAIKKLFKDWDDWTPLARHATMYAVTLVIAGGATALALTSMGMFDWTRMFLYAVYTWGHINQFWKVLKGVVKTHA